MRQDKASGTCALTHSRGTFVRSHIIPRAFTDLNLDKVSRIEFGQNGQRPSLRHSGWYDDYLVTTAGEAQLAKYDDLAAREFRKHGLCWRFFPVGPSVRRDRIGGSEFELLDVPDADTGGLRLFFLSLLWRAVATSRPEFREVRIDLESKRKLRRIVNGDVEPHVSDFPTTLLLLTTKGQPQNHTPLRQRMYIPQLAPGLQRDLKIIRFFLDGLVVHIGRRSMDERLIKAWGKRSVGAGESLLLMGRAYEGSFQEENLGLLQQELERDWPHDAKRIYGAL